MSKLKELEKRLRDEPDNLGLRVALAGAFVEAHRRDDAVELYRSVAIAYRAQGRGHQAIAVCRSVLELAPEDASSQALLTAMLAELEAAPPEPVAPEPAPILPPPRRARPPVQGPLAALGAVGPNARPPTEPMPEPPPAVIAKPPPEPPPLLPPDDPDEPEETSEREARRAPPPLDDLEDLIAQTSVGDDAAVERVSVANLARFAPRRPSTSDITPLPTPVPYHVADPTIPPKLTYHDLPPSLRANLPDELAQAAKLEGIAAAAHQISASLLASRPEDEAPATLDPLAVLDGLEDDADDANDNDADDPDDRHPVEETGEPIDDDDLIDAGEATGTGIGEITIANSLDTDDDALVQTHRQPRITDHHAALDRLGTLRPTMPLSPAARRAVGIIDAPKRPSITRVTMIDDEKTQPREVPRQLRPPTAPGGPAVDPFDSALFTALPEAQRSAVLERFRRRVAGVGTTVIRRGESGHGLVLVVRGRLDVHSERADGARISLEAICAGDYIGEISLLARAPAPAYVVAAVDCDLLVLAAEAFYDLIAAFPALRGEIRTTAERRIRSHDQLLRM